jgi:hypothetical protein
LTPADFQNRLVLDTILSSFDRTGGSNVESHLGREITMRKLILYPIVLTVACLAGASCGRDVSPTPPLETKIDVSIALDDHTSQMVVGEEAAVTIQVEPENRAGEITEITMLGDRGIRCGMSEVDRFTWYCVAPEEAENATVRAEIAGVSFTESALLRVKVVTPTPPSTPVPPTDIPTPMIAEPPLADTPIPSPTECRSLRPPLKGAADFAGEVEITTPISCTTGLPTESPIPVAGTYEGIPDGVDIWVLVYPPNMVYYIQSPSACKGAKMAQTGGNWEVPVYLGGKTGPPEWFDIVVVLAGQEASQFLSSSVMQMCQSDEYYGFPAAELEQMNIIEKSFITVQTLD